MTAPWWKEAGTDFRAALDDAVGAAAEKHQPILVVEYYAVVENRINGPVRYIITTAFDYEILKDGPIGEHGVRRPINGRTTVGVSYVVATIAVPREQDRNCWAVGKKRRVGG